MLHQCEQGVKRACATLVTCCEMHQVLDVGCGSNYLFRLTRRGGGAAADSAGTALGKLEIKWRGSLGEVGRVQTQQILGPPAPTKVSTFIVGDAAGQPVQAFGRVRTGSAGTHGPTAPI